LLAGGGVDLEELGADDGAGKIVGDQDAEFAGLDDVGADDAKILGCRRESGWDEIAAGKNVVDDLHVKHRGREEGLDLGQVDAGEEEDGIGGAFEGGEELGSEDVSIARHQRDDDAVGTTELGFVLLEGLDVGVVLRQHLAEAGINIGCRSKPAHEGGQGGKNEHECEPKPEDKRLNGTDDFGFHRVVPPR